METRTSDRQNTAPAVPEDDLLWAFSAARRPPSIFCVSESGTVASVNRPAPSPMLRIIYADVRERVARCGGAARVHREQPTDVS